MPFLQTLWKFLWEPDRDLFGTKKVTLVSKLVECNKDTVSFCDSCDHPLVVSQLQIIM